MPWGVIILATFAVLVVGNFVAGFILNHAAKRIDDNLAYAFADSDERTFGLCGEMAAARIEAGGGGTEQATATKQIMSLTHDGGGANP